MSIRTLILATLLLHPGRGWSQQRPDTRLVITQDGKEVGREEFSIRGGRGRGLSGTTLTAAARYPASAPSLRLGATLERGEGGTLDKFQLDVESPEGTTVILAAGTGARLIVRTVARGSEAGRELPGGPDVVLLDENLYSLYAQVARQATPDGKRLTAIFPRSGRRATLVARVEDGAGTGPVRIALSGDVTGTLVTDAEGRLRRLELPASRTVVAPLED